MMAEKVSNERLAELISQWSSYTRSDPFAADTVDALRELQSNRQSSRIGALTCPVCGKRSCNCGPGYAP